MAYVPLPSGWMMPSGVNDHKPKMRICHFNEEMSEGLLGNIHNMTARSPSTIGRREIHDKKLPGRRQPDNTAEYQTLYT